MGTLADFVLLVESLYFEADAAIFHADYLGNEAHLHTHGGRDQMPDVDVGSHRVVTRITLVLDQVPRGHLHIHDHVRGSEHAGSLQPQKVHRIFSAHLNPELMASAY